MSTLAFLLMQSDSGTSTAGNAAAAGIAGVMGLIWLAIAVVMIAALWKIFVKAGTRLGGDHPLLQRDRPSQDRGQTGVVAHPVPDSVRQPDHVLHRGVRSGQGLRQRRRIRPGHDLPGTDLLSDPRLERREVPGRSCDGVKRSITRCARRDPLSWIPAARCEISRRSLRSARAPDPRSAAASPRADPR